MIRNNLPLIQRFVGPVTAEQLKCVDVFASEHLAVCIPAVGSCLYAVSPDHTHPAYSFILACDDACRVATRQGVVEQPPGTVMAMSPTFVHHEVVMGEQPRYIVIMVDSSFFLAARSGYPGVPEEDYSGRVFAPRPELMGMVKEFMAESESGLPGAAALLDALAVRIVHSLIRSAHDVASLMPQVTARVEIHRAIEYLHLRYGEKVTVADLAAVAGMSPAHFSRTFRRETGKAPGDYLIGIRLDKARRRLLAGERCITTIAFTCGFSSPSHFTDTFRKRYGFPPNELIVKAE